MSWFLEVTEAAVSHELVQFSTCELHQLVLLYVTQNSHDFLSR